MSSQPARPLVISVISDLLLSHRPQSDSDFEMMVKYVTDLKPEERILVGHPGQIWKDI